MENPLLQCLCADSLATKFGSKQQIEKSAWTIGEEDPFTNLEASARETGTSWDAGRTDTVSVNSKWQEPFLQTQATFIRQGIAGAILEFSTG